MRSVQTVKTIKMMVNQRIATTHNRLLGDTLLHDMYEGAKYNSLLRSVPLNGRLRKWQHIVKQKISAEQMVHIQELLRQKTTTYQIFLVAKLATTPLV